MSGLLVNIGLYPATGGKKGGAAALWGLRQIDPAYKGNLATLFDAVGNSTHIGYYDGELDQNAAQVAIDAGQTKLKWLYDQSGNGNHLSQPDFASAPALVLDGMPSHYPVARGGYMLSPNNTLRDIFDAIGGGYMLLGMRIESGAATRTLTWGYDQQDAQFTIPVPIGPAAHMALEIFYQAKTPDASVPLVNINGAPVSVTPVQLGRGKRTIAGTPFVWGSANDGAGGFSSAFVGDIWEIHLYKGVPT